MDKVIKYGVIFIIVSVIIAAVLGVTAALAMLGGLIVQALWGWFIVPTFGLAALSLPAAMGLNLIAHYLTFHGIHLAPKEEVKKTAFIGMFVVPVAALLSGYIIQLFM